MLKPSQMNLKGTVKSFILREGFALIGSIVLMLFILMGTLVFMKPNPENDPDINTENFVLRIEVLITTISVLSVGIAINYLFRIALNQKGVRLSLTRFLLKVIDEYIVADLIEEHHSRRTEFGQRKADLWLYKQLIGSIWPLTRKAILRWLPFLSRLGR